MKRLCISLIAAVLVAAQGIGLAAPASADSLSYAALGDSVAAGVGLPSKAGATTEDLLCGKSDQSYPTIVASSLSANLTNYACSGAKADEGIYDEQTVSNTVISPQIDQAFANGVPDVITITVGANDVRWTQFLRQCYYFSCGSEFDTSRSNIYLTDLRAEMNRIMYEIQSRSGDTKPIVLVNGYYQAFSDLSCIESERISAAEAAWMNERISALNSAINYTSSRYSFATYVPIDFTNHSLCSAVPWVQGAEDVGPLHPTAAGQRAIASANIEAYNEQANQSKIEPYSFREKLIEWFTRNRS